MLCEADTDDHSVRFITTRDSQYTVHVAIWSNSTIKIPILAALNDHLGIFAFLVWDVYNLINFICSFVLMLISLNIFPDDEGGIWGGFKTEAELYFSTRWPNNWLYYVDNVLILFQEG